MIINLPVTVEMSMPHVYANQIEYCDKHLKYRDSVIISTHPHNDRGTGVACAEMAVLAGAQRVECCLFGNGERTGNVDAVTLAMNLYSHGVDPRLDFSDMPAICATYERVTRMHIYERTPTLVSWCLQPSRAAIRMPLQRAWPTARSGASIAGPAPTSPSTPRYRPHL